MFEGFTNKAIDFMWGIRFNNNREWFLAHKKEYVEDFYAPMQRLTKDVWSRMEDKFPDDAYIHLSRIYRDLRRTHGEGPYKDRLWFSVRRRCLDWRECPIFFFELEPEGYSCGIVTIDSQPEIMRRFRAHVDKNPAEFERVASILEGQDEYRLYGDSYKRKMGERDGLIGEWYNKKRICVYSDHQPDARLMSGELVGYICEGFAFLRPIYDYLWSLYDV